MQPSFHGLRQRLIRQISVITISSIVIALSACGGGGGGGSSPKPASSSSSSPASSSSSSSSSSQSSLPSVDTSAVVQADPGSALAANWQKGAFIEIYVRGYKDSDGDGIGDLKGLTQQLDYLHDLGIKGIWLMPVTRSQDRDHGYAVTDYRNIETDYGSLADFDEFVTQAHARGIGVIIDYVMNHSAAQNPLFINSADSANNPYRDWYIWRSPKPTGWNIYGNDPWKTIASGNYFAGFWDQMPDFNLTNTAVLDYHENGLRFWLNRGVDGFRFDAVGNLVENGPSAWEDQPQNYTIMNEMRTLVAGYSQRYMVCEAPADPVGFADTNACGSAFAFNLRSNIASAAQNNAAGIQAVSNYFKTTTARMATMVSNHDSFAGDRLWDQVGGNLAQYKLAAATYLLLPGTPFIYYGEEIGMSGGINLTGDWKLRTPMSWSGSTSNAGFTTGTPFRNLSSNVATQNVAAELNDNNSLLAFYKGILAVRNNNPSIAQGTYDNANVSGSLFSFQRTLNTETTLVVINYSSSAATATINNLPANASLTSVYPAGGSNATANGSGTAQIAMAAQSVQVFKVQ